MPLDGHSYLVAQGWSGKGDGLRKNAISRPLAIPQKRTLAGLGKDRDEAFPFWDHLFTVAAKTIQVKIHKDEDDDSDTDSSVPTPTVPSLARTSTGILSNKRPTVGTPASSSGSTTPSLQDPTSSSSSGNRMSLLAAAKRDAAKRYLYSRFFRGPVLGPDNEAPEIRAPSTPTISLGCNGCEAPMVQSEGGNALTDTERRESTKTETIRRKKEKSSRESKKEKKEKKKRKDKGKEKDSTPSGSDDRKRKLTDSKVKASHVEISKKGKKRKGSTDLIDGNDATARSSDVDRVRSKKMKLTSNITVEGAEDDADRESKDTKVETLERRRKKERKKGRKEKTDKRRKEVDRPSS